MELGQEKMCSILSINYVPLHSLVANQLTKVIQSDPVAVPPRCKYEISQESQLVKTWAVLMETGCLPIKHRSVLIVIIKFGVISLKFIRLMLGVSRKSTNFPCEQIMLDSHILLTALSQKMSSCVHMVALQGAMQRDFLLLNSSAFLQHLALGIIWS